VFLEVRILNELWARFAEVQILKGLVTLQQRSGRAAWGD